MNVCYYSTDFVRHWHWHLAFWKDTCFVVCRSIEHSSTKPPIATPLGCSMKCHEHASSESLKFRERTSVGPPNSINFAYFQIVAVMYIFCVTQYGAYNVTWIICNFVRRINHGENPQKIDLGGPTKVLFLISRRPYVSRYMDRP